MERYTINRMLNIRAQPLQSSMRSILITGGAGYVGVELTKSLLASGNFVHVVDTFWFGDHLKTHPNLKKYKIDIRGFDPPKELDRIDTVIHLASIANDPSADLDPAISWEIGCLGTLKMLEWAASKSVSNFILASSGSVYGVSTEPKVTEELQLIPISTYNKVKMVKERIALSYADVMNIVILRPATVAGVSDRQRLDLAVNALTFSALDKKCITLFGGNQIRPHVHIRDLIAAYEFFIPGEHSGIFNIGFENISILELGRRINKITGADIKTVPSNDPRSYRLNSDKILKLGFIPRFTVNDAIFELIEKFNTGDLIDNPMNYNINWLKKIG